MQDPTHDRYTNGCQGERISGDIGEIEALLPSTAKSAIVEFHFHE
jgi:hypothetical protein